MLHFFCHDFFSTLDELLKVLFRRVLHEVVMYYHHEPVDKITVLFRGESIYSLFTWAYFILLVDLFVRYY